MPMPRHLPLASEAARRAGKPFQSAFSMPFSMTLSKSPESKVSPSAVFHGIWFGFTRLRLRISAGPRPVSRPIWSTKRSSR